MFQDKFLSRTGTAEFLCEQGFPIKASTLECLATRGGGPPYHRFGRRALYDPSEVLVRISTVAKREIGLSAPSCACSKIAASVPKGFHLAAAILADSVPLVGCDRLDENDFLTDIGKGWNDPEFLAGAKSAKTNGNGQCGPFVRKLKSVDEFTSEYSPINYTIDGALPVSSIYGVTGRRGWAKTALLTAVSLAVLTGNKDIIGFDVEKGRVAYVILENPTDFRMKLATALYVHGINPKDISK